MEECSYVYVKAKGSNVLQKMIATTRQDDQVQNIRPIRSWRIIPRQSRGLKLAEKNTTFDEKIVKRKEAGEKVKSLFDSCLELVALNTDCLDSLEGFPDQIAFAIWNKAIAMQQFDRPCSSTVQSLDTFISAYPDEILPLCKISNLFVLNNYEEELKVLFSNVRTLDLTKCALDQDHDLLPELPKICHSLNKLILADNFLSSKSLRLIFGVPNNDDKMTTTALKSLTYLDISGNPMITYPGVKRYIMENRPKNLSTLVLSVESHKHLRDIDKTFVTSFWQRRFGPNDILAIKQDNEGWAKELLEQWDKTEKIKGKARSNMKTNFYRNQKVLDNVEEEKPSCPKTQSVIVTYDKCLVERPIMLPKAKKIKLDHRPQQGRRHVDDEDNLIS
jgi:hypothetical protein